MSDVFLDCETFGCVSLLLTWPISPVLNTKQQQVESPRYYIQTFLFSYETQISKWLGILQIILTMTLKAPTPSSFVGNAMIFIHSAYMGFKGESDDLLYLCFSCND